MNGMLISDGGGMHICTQDLGIRGIVEMRSGKLRVLQYMDLDFSLRHSLDARFAKYPFRWRVAVQWLSDDCVNEIDTSDRRNLPQISTSVAIFEYGKDGVAN